MGLGQGLQANLSESPPRGTSAIAILEHIRDNALAVFASTPSPSVLAETVQFIHRNATAAARATMLGGADALVLFGAHSPPTCRSRSWFMPGGTTWAQLST